MKHGSLFSGIGGFDLAAEWMGWENVFHCEWNPFGQKIINHYWPNAKSYSDITKTDFSIHRGSIDILTGGFPCQPYSAAGKRKGKEDERHLWPEMLRAIGEIHPSWIVGENVLGLLNWSGGLVFNEVQADLETKGYNVWPYVLPACGVNAPHRRDRVWFIANSKDGNTTRGEGISDEGQSCTKEIWCGFRDESSCNGSDGTTSNSHEKRLSNEEQIRKLGRGRFGFDNFGNVWEKFPTQRPVCNGNDGIPGGLDGITFSKWREESIMAGGNAIVPQVAYNIFKAIEQTEQTLFKP